MDMNNLNVASAILGALATGLVGGAFKFVYYLYTRKEAAEKSTFNKIIFRLERIDEKNADFREEWGAFKKELQMISASAMVVKQASEEIIIVRRNLDTAFKRVDELRISDEGLSSSVRQGYALILGRLSILRNSIEALGGKVDRSDWSDPSNNDLIGKI